MNEDAALKAAIVAEPDEDMPRLAYADWLDENKSDELPSPAESSSAWAEFIRVQCRLAAGAFDDSDYPELLERENNLGHWLSLYLPDLEPNTGYSDCNASFEGGEWGNSRRGFPEIIEYGTYKDTAEETVEAIVQILEKRFAQGPARTLNLIDALTDEIALLVRHPIFEQLRGLYLDGLEDYVVDEAIAAIAGSRWSKGLRRLHIDNIPLDNPVCKVLAQSPHLRNLESLAITHPVSASSLEVFGQSKWFRKLRRLHVSFRLDDGFRALANLPALRQLQWLRVSGAEFTSTAAMKRFAASRSFPALAYLDLSETQFSMDQVIALTRGKWPLRHLRLRQNEVRKAGVEALSAAPFAPMLRVLELPWCEITSSGVQELAHSESLAGLRHLSLAENPIGPGGLAAIADSKTLRELSSLDLGRTNTPRGPIGARDVLQFLKKLEMPNLRRLMLTQLPVGARGARVLATTSQFANLTQLLLEGCSLGESGTKHLVLSTTLNNLVALDMSENKTGSSASKLLNPNVLPKLANCSLGTGIPKATATRLRRRAGIII